jgi:dynein heavy chain, axonemal
MTIATALNHRSEMANNKCARPFPDEGTIYDYKYSEEACEGSGSWIGWMDSVEVYKLDPKLGFSELIVPTADSICYTFLLDQVS